MKQDTTDISALIGDFTSDSGANIKEIVTWFLNRVMIEEIEKQAKELVEKSGNPEDGYRNGYKPRTLKTTNGKLQLNKPQLRNHPFETKVFERYSRVDKALGNVVRESYIAGASTKGVKEIVAALGITEMSPDTVSRIANELDVEVSAFLSRPIVHECPYIFIDATYFKTRNGGRYINKALFIAYGINEEGYREVLGVKIAGSEKEDFWSDFFEEMTQRGLKGVKLVVSDGHKGIEAAVGKYFLGCSWQMCIVHLKRAVLNKVPKKQVSEVKGILRLLDIGEDGLNLAVEKLDEMGLESASNVLERYRPAMFNYQAFPREHWRKLYTTNGVERVNLEIKRRIKKIGAFPSDESALRLMVSIIMNIDEEWMCGRRMYLHMNP